ncbi:hypothetical protein K435DRAFT_851434 [Dendrothele bispora CBS 962.96]|uniref:F-box domain-containing protein n=1 Tax=Dendrothele bispora (strain CBS 962.96) TaxID=1314807 RepID=A0A4S8MLR2_DENBC|nr:hypothetical protein K435DRAFT_851434 [Dendrothele bispora CBS 962.96]
MSPSLQDLPNELLDLVAFHYACSQLHGLPNSLTPLLLISRACNLHLSNSPALYARIFNYKFSSSAVRRRAFSPKSSEYYWQLKEYCSVLGNIKRRLLLPNLFDESDADEPTLRELFFALWTMCLDDDGCNRMQMECAGVYTWVECFVRNHLYVDADNGWPRDNACNSFAMWIMWFLSTKTRILDESEEDRESLIKLVLPFVTVPYRYPSTYAPPHHFHLPLTNSSSHYEQQARSSHAYTIPTPHGPYPIYISPERIWLHVYYERRTPTTIPLVTESAKLLYFSRREVIRFGIAPTLPADRQEFNNRRREALRHEAQVSGNALSSTQLEERVAGEVGVTKEDIEEVNASLLGGALIEADEAHLASRYGRGGGTALVESAPSLSNERGEYIEIDESACLSQRWDNDWWRIRQCGNCWEDGDVEDVSPRASGPMSSPSMTTVYPKMGKVYEPGSLTGLWTGRMLIPTEDRLQALLIPPQPDPDREQGQNGPIQTPSPDSAAGLSEDGQNEDDDANRQPDPTDHINSFPFPPLFSEDYLGPAATVPVFMRLTEYVCYAPNRACPTGGPRAGVDSDQGFSNGYFPIGTEFRPTSDGQGLRVLVPARSAQSGRVEEYIYQVYRRPSSGVAADHTMETNARLEPGRFHDRETCPGCRAREELLSRVRREEAEHLEDEVEEVECDEEEDDDTLDSVSQSTSASTTSSFSYNEELPPHDPHKILPCDGIQDIIVVGETDKRHGMAWNPFKFYGRVRPYDGMVGLLRSPVGFATLLVRLGSLTIFPLPSRFLRLHAFL